MIKFNRRLGIVKEVFSKYRSVSFLAFVDRHNTVGTLAQLAGPEFVIITPKALRVAIGKTSAKVVTTTEYMKLLPKAEKIMWFTLLKEHDHVVVAMLERNSHSRNF